MTTRVAGGAEARPLAFMLVFVALCAALNLVGGYVAGLVRLPIFLDTFGTAVGAIVLGPWWGALAGVISNLVGVTYNGPTNALFAPVNVAAALVWGYGVRSWGMGRTQPRFFVLNLLVVLVVAVTATPIVLWLGGATGHPSDIITVTLSRLGPWGAVFADNLIVGMVDKVVTGYLALAVALALPPHLLVGVDLPARGNGRWVAVAAGLVMAVVLWIALVAIGATSPP